MHRLSENLFFDLFEKAIDRNQIQAFFDNFFNEQVHKAKAEFIEKFRDFTIAVFAEYPQESNKQTNLRRNILFTILRYIHFINSDKD